MEFEQTFFWLACGPRAARGCRRRRAAPGQQAGHAASWLLRPSARDGVQVVGVEQIFGGGVDL